MLQGQFDFGRADSVFVTARSDAEPAYARSSMFLILNPRPLQRREFFRL